MERTKARWDIWASLVENKKITEENIYDKRLY
jgi:hypothetical protein